VRTDDDLGSVKRDVTGDADEDNQERSLQWLLEMDLSEPEEILFTVAGDDYHDEGLTAYEEQVAGRPLIRGNDAGDDLASYVDEVIVISSDSLRNGIYVQSEPEAVESAEEKKDEVMAIDYSRGRESESFFVTSEVDEGTDILGLSGDDDIGENAMPIKRTKLRAEPPVECIGPIMDSAPVVCEADESKLKDSLNGSVSVPKEVYGAPPATINLTEAPVPTQIADSSLGAVANESGVAEEPEHASVSDYVAHMPQSVDDEEFDKFLLGGRNLQDSESDLEELTVQLTEGVVSVDPTTEVSIDYHEDFHAMEEGAQSSVSAISVVITPVMEELSSAVRARAQELGLGADAVTVDVTHGSDEGAIKRCYADGYEPILAICCELPQPLQSLGQIDRDAIYVRLISSATNDNWNDLFTSDFVAYQGDVGSENVEYEMAELLESRAPESTDAKTCAHVEAVFADGFGEDIFGEDFSDDFADELLGGIDTAVPDIEAAFSSLSTGEEVHGDVGVADLASAQNDDVERTAKAQTNSEVEDAIAELSAPVVEAQALPPAKISEQVQQAQAQAQEQQQEREQAKEQEVAAEPVEGIEAEKQSEWAVFDGRKKGSCIPADIQFSYTSQSNAEIFSDFLDAFIEEGSSEVEKLESEVCEWEKEITSEALFANVSRTLHTIKGIAKGVGLQRMGTLVHNFETLLEKMPRPDDGEDPTYFLIVNTWLDAVVRGVESIADKRVDIASELPVQAEKLIDAQQPEEGNSVVAKADNSKKNGAESAQQIEGANVTQHGEQKSTQLSALEKKRDQQLADEGAKVLAAQQSVRITSEKLDLLLNLTSQAQQLGVRASQNTSSSKRSSAELQGRLTSVRTHIRKIADRALLNVNAQGLNLTAEMDALEMDQYSELQEAASILREGVEDLADLVDVVSRQNGQIEALLKQQSTVISTISSSIQGARVVPVSRLMPGLRRIVRTVGTDLGKVVSFKVLNETGALDRDHYARLQIILEHMVRNALDHGIESPDDRVAMGKPTGGRITIDVRKSGGDYLIRLSDDGKGIDPDAIRESAYEKGLEVDVDELTDEEAMRLIFHKGFSTADELSEVSGRGVGMDIVLTELQQIGGDIQIQSALGLGTSFDVRIPSNVSVNGALLVDAAGESYAIPLNGLAAVEQIPVHEFFAAVEAGTSLPIAGMACEPAYLGTLCQGVGVPDRSMWGKFVPVIVAGTAERYMAIAIDNLEEALELVVRSLGSQFSTVPGVAGAATTTDGEAIIALDLNLLVGSAGADGIAPVAVSKPKDTRMLALVVDDSRTQRMVATSQLDIVGVETVTAENGLVAIDLLNAAHRLPDVVLLDVEMPVKDGIQTLREIRKSRRYGHLPVIMVTSRTGSKHRALAKEAGCNAYMGKPFNFPALIKQINELTGYDLQLS
jgi:chemotaxis protein histidine kinase CheA